MNEVYVVRDCFGEYVADEFGSERTLDYDGAFEFERLHDALAACTRATDRVLSRIVL